MIDSYCVLDTHIWYWLLTGDKKITTKYKKQLIVFAKNNALLVPAISVWEVAMLYKKNRLIFTEPIDQWIKKALSKSGMCLAELTPEISLESCKLPGELHSDPADRIIISTARVHQAVLATHDKKILEYAKQGYVKTLEL